MKMSIEKWIVLGMTVLLGIVSGQAATIILDLQAGGALAGFNTSDFLAGTDQVFEDVGGISGLDLTVSLDENTYIGGLSQNSNSGFWALISGTTAAPGDSRGALGMTFTFTTTGDEVVTAFRMFDGSPHNTTYRLISPEALRVYSNEGITFTASVDEGGSIGATGVNTYLWGLSGGSVYQYEIASENGSGANPISEVSFSYYMNSRTAWDNNQVFAFEITTGSTLPPEPIVFPSSIEMEVVGTNVVLAWPGDVGESFSYALQQRENLESGAWSNIVTGLTTASNGLVSVTNAMGSASVFYRAVAE